MQVNESELHRLIGDTIRKRRKLAGMTQTELAEKVGLLRTSITNIEAGRQRAPLQVLYNICVAVGVEVREVLPTNAEALQLNMVEVEVDGKKKSVPAKAARLLSELLSE
jgi:transcriptional regulator with XRE-family HTH domain